MHLLQRGVKLDSSGGMGGGGGGASQKAFLSPREKQIILCGKFFLSLVTRKIALLSLM